MGIYDAIFSINAGLFIILVIVIVEVFDSLYDVSQNCLYAVCGLLLLITFEVLYGHLRKRLNNKYQLVKFKINKKKFYFMEIVF